MVSVPLDPSDITRGQIRLQVAVLRAWHTSPAPAPTPNSSPNAAPNAVPVLFLDGGPGDMTLGPPDNTDVLSFWMRQTRRLRLNHDVILFDGRGTGGSWPSLECPEVEALTEDDGIIPGDLAQAQQRDASAHLACRDRLQQGSVDLSLLNSPVLAADALAVLDALGVTTANLWAVSYGTRVALEVMRRAPERIRAAVLDGVYPPTVAGMESDRARFQATLDSIFAACSAQTTCAKAFPDLDASFHRTLRRYARHPYHYPMHDGPDLIVDDRAIVMAVLLALHNHEAIPHIPSLLHHLAQDDTRVLEALASWPELLADRRASEAVYLQMSCTEDWALADPGLVTEDHREHPWADAAAMPLMDRICPDWLSGQAVGPWSASAPTPVDVAVPTLLMSGAFDPTTPHTWAEAALRTLPQARHVVLADAGHATTFGHDCGEWTLVSFLRRPEAPLPRCLETTSQPVFLTGFPNLDFFWM